MVLRTRISALALLAACLSSGCAGGPSAKRVLTVQKGERTLVQLQQPATSRTLSLQNESCSPRADVYSDERSDAHLKVLDDANMQGLLDALASAGFFENAGDTTMPARREAILIRHGDRSYVWARSEGEPIKRIESFINAKGYFVRAYELSSSYHARKVSGDALRAELEAQEQRNAAARQRAGRQGQGQ